MKLLIDECLSEELAKLAREHGHRESSHVVWLGMASWKDWNLMAFVLEGDWTLVTRNSVDFRGPAKAKGSRGQHSKAELHTGLICLNGPVGMDLDMQLDLLTIALEELAPDADLINQCLEVTAHEEGEISVVRYALPMTEQ
jgi:hypothetical protein